jgi:hypothetical protein
MQRITSSGQPSPDVPLLHDLTPSREEYLDGESEGAGACDEHAARGGTGISSITKIDSDEVRANNMSDSAVPVHLDHHIAEPWAIEGKDLRVCSMGRSSEEVTCGNEH